MPTLLYKDVGLVKGVGFDSWRRVGGIIQAVKVYNLREVDEMVLLDVGASMSGREPDFELIDDVADECFMPLIVGGGLRTLNHVRQMLRVGADKVTINTAAVEAKEMVRESAHEFGSQCVVVSIDVRRSKGEYEVYTRCGSVATGLNPVEWAQEAESLGAGEILLTSVERDGTMQGYDLELLRNISAAVSIPVIASGGAGSFEHMAAALQNGNVSAVAAASMFHFTQQTPREAKQFLGARGFPVRLGI